MEYSEVNLGVNGKLSPLQNSIEHDGPISVVLQNEGDGEYALAIKKGTDALYSATEPKYGVEAKAAVVYNPPDDAETDFQGVANGNTPNPHPVLVTGTDGQTSAAATRTLTSAGSDFVTAGVKVGDVLVVNEGGGSDNGEYRIVEVTSATVLTIDRDWPVGGSAATQDFNVYSRTVVAPGSVSIGVTITGTSAVVNITDDGEGVLYGLIVPADPGPLAEIHGTINYFTGEWEFSSDTALKNATDIELTYAESLPVVAGGKISFPIVNSRHGEPIHMAGIGNGADVKCLVKAFVG
jgi:hypothetical protein